MSYLDYRKVLHVGLPLKITWKLQLSQNVSARIMIEIEYCKCIVPVLYDLH